ncbi:MAG: hypothetical protein K0S75_656 [Clostridia bacterium]|jgi:hypothetical protein|nr:hypothetical protein [Clostridia bacterium]
MRVIFLDERRQYVPTATRTFPADNNTVGIKPESIVREAVNKITDYKNVERVPVDTSVAEANSRDDKIKTD